MLRGLLGIIENARSELDQAHDEQEDQDTSFSAASHGGVQGLGVSGLDTSVLRADASFLGDHEVDFDISELSVLEAADEYDEDEDADSDEEHDFHDMGVDDDEDGSHHGERADLWDDADETFTGMHDFPLGMGLGDSSAFNHLVTDASGDLFEIEINTVESSDGEGGDTVTISLANSSNDSNGYGGGMGNGLAPFPSFDNYDGGDDGEQGMTTLEVWSPSADADSATSATSGAASTKKEDSSWQQLLPAGMSAGAGSRANTSNNTATAAPTKKEAHKRFLHEMYHLGYGWDNNSERSGGVVLNATDRLGSEAEVHTHIAGDRSSQLGLRGGIDGDALVFNDELFYKGEGGAWGGTGGSGGVFREAPAPLFPSAKAVRSDMEARGVAWDFASPGDGDDNAAGDGEEV